MERVFMLLLPELCAIVFAFVFTLVYIIFVVMLNKKKTKVKNVELHVGKHHWFKVEYK